MVSNSSRIKCNRCHRIRSNMAYSKRQILALRFELSKGNRSALTGNGVATCNQCTANQAHEMTCCVCDKTKPKEKFSKAQRKNPDAAVCVAFTHSTYCQVSRASLTHFLYSVATTVSKHIWMRSRYWKKRRTTLPLLYLILR